MPSHPPSFAVRSTLRSLRFVQDGDWEESTGCGVMLLRWTVILSCQRHSGSCSYIMVVCGGGPCRKILQRNYRFASGARIFLFCVVSNSSALASHGPAYLAGDSTVLSMNASLFQMPRYFSRPLYSIFLCLCVTWAGGYLYASGDGRTPPPFYTPAQ